MSAPNAIQIIYECLTDVSSATYAIINTRAWCPQAPDGWLNKQAAIVYSVYEDITHIAQQSDLVAVVAFECFSGDTSWANCRLLHEALRTTIQRRGKKYTSGTIQAARPISGNPGAFVEGDGKGTLWKCAEAEYRIRFTV